jgi:hypothetical protein
MVNMGMAQYYGIYFGSIKAKVAVQNVGFAAQPLKHATVEQYGTAIVEPQQMF